MTKTLITEAIVREAIATGKKSVPVLPDFIITSLARELAQRENVEFTSAVPERKPDVTPTTEIPRSLEMGSVVIGSDHGGYQYKEVLKELVGSLGYAVIDVGTGNETPCDFPDFAYAVAVSVSSGKAKRGIMIDGAGVGSCVVANKVPGVRAACCHNEFVARNAREHNDTNVLTLGSRVIGIEVCREIVKIWLDSWFAGGRHKTRVDKISDLEKKYLK